MTIYVAGLIRSTLTNIHNMLHAINIYLIPPLFLNYVSLAIFFSRGDYLGESDIFSKFCVTFFQTLCLTPDSGSINVSKTAGQAEIVFLS